jgi:hypothetical protein
MARISVDPTGRAYCEKKRLLVVSPLLDGI